MRPKKEPVFGTPESRAAYKSTGGTLTTREDVSQRFTYHPPADNDTQKAHEFARELCRGAALAFHEMLPESREKSLALTALQEAMMWANGAIAIHGLPDSGRGIVRNEA